MIHMQYKYGHTPFNRLQSMATNGALPNRLGACPHPVYTSFLYGESTKLLRNTKTERSINSYKLVVSVVEFISLGVLVSINPFLILKMSIFITRQCYQNASLFVNHRSDFTYLHLLKSQTGDESVEVKEYFESYA